MASPEKRCHYEVLALNRDCTADEIRSAYRKLALQRHPDKLVQSGVSVSEATAKFQELVNAYEVLSDPRERAWYDSHRSQILFSDSNSSSLSKTSSTFVPDLFAFFSNSVFSGFGSTGKGFYKVYADVFDKIYANELNFAKKLGLGLDSVKGAPVMGNLESPYTQVTAFYGYWLGFVTVMDFCWADQWDAMSGLNRKSRRLMEEENKKVRKKARREYNDTVRGLAEFVKKRDKRVIDMQVKRSEEMERKKEEERERKKKLERERVERTMRHEEPEWAKVDEDENGGFEEVEDDNEEKKNEFYCVVCGKKFKSEKQWKNHEQSKKHKEKVAEFKEACSDEEREEEDEEELEDDGGDVDELQKEFEGSFGIQEEKSDNNGDEAQSSEEEKSDNNLEEILDDDDEDEAIAVETMVSGSEKPESNGKASATEANVEDETDEKDTVAYTKRKSRRRNKGAKREEAPVENDSDETDSMAYNNRKKSMRRNRGARREEENVEDDSDETDSMAYNNRKKSTRRRQRGQKTSKESTRAETNSGVEQNNGHNDGLHKEEEEKSQSVVEDVIHGKVDDLERNHKGSKQNVDKKGTTKKETDTKSKNASKGKKQKATSKTSSTVCDTCGEDFESRNKLYKHIGDTGHATLKSR